MSVFVEINLYWTRGEFPVLVDTTSKYLLKCLTFGARILDFQFPFKISKSSFHSAKGTMLVRNRKFKKRW